MRKWFWWGVLLCLVPVLASGATGLFDVRMDVDDQSVDQREAAVREGLRRIVVRLTGRETPEDEQALGALLDNADQYVQQYGYDDVDNGVELRVRYDGPALQDALAQREIALWPVDGRPRTLAWVVVNRGGDRRIVSSEDSPELRRSLRQSAASAGLPLLFPLMDLQDQQAVSTSDLWGGFREPIMEASRRYDAEGVLLGRVDRRGDAWRSRWTLFWDGETHDWTVEQDELEAALATGVDTGAVRLAERYATVPDPDSIGRVALRVRDVGGLEAYARVEAHLRGVRDVEAVEVLRVADRTVDFRLRVRGLSERALERLRDSRLLTETERESDDAEAEGALPGLRPDYVFRLRGAGGEG